MYLYRELEMDETDRIKDIDGTCFIKNAWRMNADTGKYELVEINWQDDDLPNGLGWHVKHLRRTFEHGGTVFGCFDGDLLVGFATLEANPFGSKEQHVLLEQLYVSKDYRGKGIGRKLIELCKDQARKLDASRIRLYAGSSEDTIAFYKRVGCIPAEETNKVLAEIDPNDIQLDLLL